MSAESMGSIEQGPSREALVRAIVDMEASVSGSLGAVDSLLELVLQALGRPDAESHLAHVACVLEVVKERVAFVANDAEVELEGLGIGRFAR